VISCYLPAKTEYFECFWFRRLVCVFTAIGEPLVKLTAWSRRHCCAIWSDLVCGIKRVARLGLIFARLERVQERKHEGLHSDLFKL